MLPCAPPGGGYLVLSKAHLRNSEFMRLVREAYPHTKIIEQQPIPLARPHPPAKG